ncbi:MAG: NUDIX domain-containing protein [Janthinobacterium lividum]
MLLAYPCDMASPFYFLPGGHVEYGESLKAALIRELCEETGYNFKIVRFLGCLEHKFEIRPDLQLCRNHEYNFISLDSSDKCKAGILPPQLEQHIYFKWVSLDQIGYINVLPKSLSHLINNWLEKDFDESIYSQILN